MKRDELVEEFLRASRALVGLSVQSVAAAPVEVTLVQHRLLVLLAARGEQTVGDIAAELGVNPSNATRHCDRLQRLGLVERRRSEQDGRVVQIALTGAGREVVEAVSARRRDQVRQVLDGMAVEDVEAVLAGLRAFSDAAHESAERDWVTVLG
ncbi:MarR family winged helix-turn-helix transcriptional regulator [Nocardioides sp. MAHUQ-72]|uniref:MarR family winged helix-turn-helix transcriptional regulator n=1 Tax=unclassified Nocardioides TaxID=2615069 RepID=UPI00360C0B58